MLNLLYQIFNFLQKNKEDKQQKNSNYTKSLFWFEIFSGIYTYSASWVVFLVNDDWVIDVCHHNIFIGDVHRTTAVLGDEPPQLLILRPLSVSFMVQFLSE